MFLNRLKAEAKKDFMYLAIKATEINGVVEEEEEMLLKEYCREMLIDIPEDSDSITFEELITRFSTVSEENKRIIVFELLGLMYVDGVFDESEKDFVNRFVDGINMSEDVFASVVCCMDHYIETVTEITKMLLLDSDSDKCDRSLN